MKNITLLCIYFCLIITAKAQTMIGDGNRMIGGGISFSETSQEGDRVNGYFNYNLQNDEKFERSSFSFSPYYGKFYNEDALLGFGFNYTRNIYERTNRDSIEDVRSDHNYGGLGVFIFIKRYIAVSNRFGVFVTPKLSYMRRKTEYDSERIDNFEDKRVWGYSELIKSNSISANIDLGLYYFIFDQLSIETNLLSANISFEKSKWEYIDLVEEEEFDGTNDSSNIALSFVNSFTFDKLFTLNYFF